MRSVQSIEKTRIASNGERFCWTICTNFSRSVEKEKENERHMVLSSGFPFTLYRCNGCTTKRLTARRLVEGRGRRDGPAGPGSAGWRASFRDAALRFESDGKWS